MTEGIENAEAEAAAAERMLDKLRAFIGSLDDDERRSFAALVGPGVALAHSGPVDEDDVGGFATTWQPRRLPQHLAEAVRLRKFGVDDS